MLFIQRNVTFDAAARLRSVGMIAAACALFLSGCATLGGGTPEDQVRERAQARWTAIVTGKWDKAYSYATPGYRQAVNVGGFTGRSAPAAKLMSVEVVNLLCKD